MAEPKNNRHKSEQDVGTPPEFLVAVLSRLNVDDFSIDLAASGRYHVVKPYLTEADDALTVDWWPYSNAGQWAWLNPPFGDIGPWVQRAWKQSRLGAHIAMVFPASIDTQWWEDWVRHKGYVIPLRNRIKFIGQDQGFPKPLVLVLYAPFIVGGESEAWDWKSQA